MVGCMYNNWKGQQNRTGMESSEGKLYFLSQLSTFCVLKGVKGRLDVQFNWLWRPRLLTERTSSYRVLSFPRRWFSFSQLFRKYDSSSFDRLFNNDLSIIGGWWFWHLRWDFKMNQESIFSSYADKRIECILISMITASSVIMFVMIIMVIIIMISRHQYHDQHDNQQEDHEGQTIAKPHAFPASWGHCTLPRQVLFPQMSDASLLFFLLFWKTQKLTQLSPQPVQNVGRARHQGLSRQHSTSNLGGCNHLLKFFQFFPPFLQIINSFFIHTGESQAVKRLIVSASLAITSANEY